MEVKFLNQPKEVKFGDVLNQRLKESFDEVFIIAGLVKDTGIEIIQDSLEQAVSDGGKINMFIGIDRKNTSKDMLLKLLSIGINLNAHINTDENKVETRGYIFDSKNGDSYIYMTSAKLSNGGLLNNASVIIEVKYHNDERQAFESAKNSVLMSTVNQFYKIGEEEIILLAEKGEIVARIIDRKIPKISEIYGSANNSIGEQVYDESSSNSTIDVDNLEDVDIDIDFGISMRSNVMLETEKEQKKEQKERKELLENLSIKEKDLEKLYGKNIDEIEEKRKPTILISKELNYANMNTFMIELNKISQSGQFEIPKSISDNLIKFFIDEDFCEENITVDDIRFEFIDNKTNKAQKDEKTQIILNSNGIFIKSDIILNLNPEKGDIIRIIKESHKNFKCEIIRKDTEEYNVWNCFLINSVPGQKRKFGIS